jgi:hypothetical protein
MEARISNGDKLTLLVDLDDTLFKVSKLSRFFFNLSQKIFLLGFRFEKPNRRMLKLTDQYDRIVVVSSRANDWMKNVTMKQLKKSGIVADGVILCPRGKLYSIWKQETVKEFRKAYPNSEWVDNDFTGVIE